VAIHIDNKQNKGM